MLAGKPWWLRLFVGVLAFALIWSMLRHVERNINPQGWDLQMSQKIQDNQELTKENLERAGKVMPAAE